MVEPQKRSAVFALWEQGKSKSQIARLLALDVKTVQGIIASHGQQRNPISRSHPLPPPDTLIELYRRCDGYVHRMHEILTEEQGHALGYSTLTRALRRLGIARGSQPQRAEHVPDVPGQEMQQDTSTYRITLGDNAPVKLICSGLYLRYKRRFIRELLDLCRTCDETVFVSLMGRALTFRVHSIAALLRMAVQISAPAAKTAQDQPAPLPQQDYQARPAYRQGEFSREHDSSSIIDTPTQPPGDNHGSTTA